MRTEDSLNSLNSRSTARATRPYFCPLKPNLDNGGGGVQVFFEDEIEFNWHMGMSWQVKQRSSNEMAKAIVDKWSPNIDRNEILEVSTASADYDSGRALSALNLMYRNEETGEYHSVEGWFQSSKVFEKGEDSLFEEFKQTFGPYRELLSRRYPARYLNQNLNAKIRSQYQNDDLFQRIQHEIKGVALNKFVFEGQEMPLIPRSGFYDYLYIKALSQPQNDVLAERIMQFRVFTDIMFNPGKGKNKKYNTQARSCSIFVALKQRNLLEKALSSFNDFIKVVSYEKSE